MPTLPHTSNSNVEHDIFHDRNHPAVQRSPHIRGKPGPKCVKRRRERARERVAEMRLERGCGRGRTGAGGRRQ